MIHLKNSGYTPRDAAHLLSRSRELTSEMDAEIRDARISSRYLELDVSVDEDELPQFVNRLDPIGPLDHSQHIVEEQIEKPEAIEKGRFFFNHERYWECHEVLEGVWKKSSESEKDLLQGIILVAAALVHYQKNEKTICLSILRRALEKLTNATGKYYNIDIDIFRTKVSQTLKSGLIETFTI